MSKNNTSSLTGANLSMLSLDEVARIGAQEMLRVALESEISLYLEQMSEHRLPDGKAAIVRNGYHRSRQVTVGSGTIKATVPRTRNRSSSEETFMSSIVPKYMRRSLKIDEAIPLLYLKGISTGNMEEALTPLLGEQVSGLSASVVSRLKANWSDEYVAWMSRDLSQKKYCYLYADGIHTAVRFEDKKSCLLVIIGVTEHGRKELVAVSSGGRESEATWEEVLRDLQGRGMVGASLAIGDGALGFWNAMRIVYPETEHQRCWVHKKRNILKRLPDSLLDEGNRMIDNIFNAESKQVAEEACDAFKRRFEATQYRAVECLFKDKDVLLQFYSYPREHWKHIRSTNPIESTFATVRLRTNSTRGMGTAETTFMMVFKLLDSAQKRWQRVFGYALIPFVLEGRVFKDGLEVKEAA